MTAFWQPTSSQYPLLVILAALVLLGVVVIVSAWESNRRDARVDETIRRRYMWTSHAD